jgi:general L-amino acid transport system substrate-binding protein
VLPEVISKEPLGPVVRNGDEDWLKIVRWSLFAMVNAEELGVNSKNVDEIKKNAKDPGKQRLLGVSGIGGQGLKLSDDWAYNIIKEVGNYGEIFERNVGKDTPLGISRGLNALWNKGGIQYAPPIR